MKASQPTKLTESLGEYYLLKRPISGDNISVMETRLMISAILLARFSVNEAYVHVKGTFRGKTVTFI